MSSRSATQRLLEILQVTGFVAAAAWALFAFSYSAWPKFFPYFIGELHLGMGEWSNERSGCVYDVWVELTNKSVRGQSIDEVRYFSSWEKLPELSGSDQIQLVDLYRAPNEAERLDLGREAKSPLEFDYPPEQSTLDGFEIFATPKPKHALLIVLEVYQREEKVGYYYAWQNTCSPPKEAS